MTTRSARSTVTFCRAFALPGFPGELPAGQYDLLVEEERLQGVSFEVWRRTGTYLLVQGTGARAGRSEMRSTTESDLKSALDRDQAPLGTATDSDAALSPREDKT